MFGTRALTLVVEPSLQVVGISRKSCITIAQATGIRLEKRSLQLALGYLVVAGEDVAHFDDPPRTEWGLYAINTGSSVRSTKCDDAERVDVGRWSSTTRLADSLLGFM